jgi:predicted metal-dependent HD superfamily phosphohydrolase
MMSLKERFLHLCTPFTKDPYLIDTLWSEIEKKHSEKGRHYHNLQHLDHIFSEFDSVKSKIESFTVISFSVFYHDVVYDAASKSNEEKSAELAESKLQELNIDQNLIIKVSRQIIATKSHQKSDDSDTNYLLDADLSILGQDAETYREYTQKIRKEYSYILICSISREGRKSCGISWNWIVFLKRRISEKNMKKGQGKIYCLKSKACSLIYINASQAS